MCKLVPRKIYTFHNDPKYTREDMFFNESTTLHTLHNWIPLSSGTARLTFTEYMLETRLTIISRKPRLRGHPRLLPVRPPHSLHCRHRPRERRSRIHDFGVSPTALSVLSCPTLSARLWGR